MFGGLPCESPNNPKMIEGGRVSATRVLSRRQDDLCTMVVCHLTGEDLLEEDKTGEEDEDNNEL